MTMVRFLSAGVFALLVLFADLAPEPPHPPDVPPPRPPARGLPPLRLPDPARLRLASEYALILDQAEGRVLYAKAPDTPTPVASLTKLMTAIVVLEGGQPPSEPLRITPQDTDTLRGSASHLPVGWVLTRAELLQLALMSSDNRAAHALARSYPGGVPAFVEAMNRKASALGLACTRFADPTGLDAGNVSTAQDLAALVGVAARYAAIRRLTTTPQHTALSLASGHARIFGNSNPLVRDPAWEIALSKTGYISDSGFCLVMQARLAGRPTSIVLLRAGGKESRTADARRVRQWLEGATDLARRATPPGTATGA